VLIRIRAFGINRSELFTRQSHSPGVRFPPVLGIECVGEVVDGGDTDLAPGQRVAALMGGILGGCWVLDRFEPTRGFPRGVRLTMYSGGSGDLTAEELDGYCDAVEAGRASVPIDRVFPFEQLVQAHAHLDNLARGKIVVEVA
jgi:NADPH:quinone reductase-like Zn-dependent oxidoreductase